jgi:SRSO17 transposase
VLSPSSFWDALMELPIVEFPSYVEELSAEFRPLFEQERQVNQFKRLMTGFVMAEQKTIAHMNGLFTFHTNQSNLNRFVTSSDWNQTEMSRIQIDMINEVEEETGIVVLDDFIVEKYGTEIYGVDWHRDHAKKRLFGDCR